MTGRSRPKGFVAVLRTSAGMAKSRQKGVHKGTSWGREVVNLSPQYFASSAMFPKTNGYLSRVALSPCVRVNLLPGSTCKPKHRWGGVVQGSLFVSRGSEFVLNNVFESPTDEGREAQEGEES